MSARTTIEQAIAALRTGRAVRIGGDRPIAVAAVETATAVMLGLLDSTGTAPMIISGERAQALSLSNQREAAAPSRPVLLERASWLDPETALALVDPGRDGERAPIGPLVPILCDFPDKATAALQLARFAGLLPALWVVDPAQAAVEVGIEDLDRVTPEVTLIARAALPLEGLEDVQVAAFRGSDDGAEHVALIVGAFGGQPPLVRLHSECLTGDVFGSLKCDCGIQLRESLRIIGVEGSGVLLYLRQEGRGIGLANKLRAYALQDRGLDTVDANARLGFADDERDYGHAAAILRALGIGAVRLLTNNPAKVEGLESAGITVVERVPHQMPTNPHNADYLATKKARSGHLS